MIEKQIQSSLLNNTAIEFLGEKSFEICGNTIAAQEVSGDFYDFYMLDEDNLVFIIGDAAGKGKTAAAFSCNAKEILRQCFLKENDINKIALELNEKLMENNDDFMFITVFLGRINLKSGDMFYLNAGHMPPLIKKFLKEVEFLKVKSNCALGVVQNPKFEVQNIKLDINDILFFYTDGITEARNFSEKSFGKERLKKILNESTEYKCIYAYMYEIKKCLNEFCKSEAVNDDVTMMIFKYMG